MHRSNVLLPEPLGPQTTTVLPCSISRVTSLSTFWSPNHLLTFSIRMILLCSGAAVASGVESSVRSS